MSTATVPPVADTRPPNGGAPGLNQLGSNTCTLYVMIVALKPRLRAWQAMTTAKVPPSSSWGISSMTWFSEMRSPKKRYTACRQVGPHVK